MQKIRTLSLYLITILTFTGYTYAVEPDDSEALLEALSPDQRESVLGKMNRRDSLDEDVNEAFSETNTLIERPEQELLDEECNFRLTGIYKNEIIH